MGNRATLVCLAFVGCGDGGSADPIDAAITLIDAAPDIAVVMDAPAPAYDFSCSGNPAPTTATAQITLSGRAQRIEFNGSVMINPLNGASIRACRAPGAPNCNTAGNQYGTTATSAGMGDYSIGPIDTQGAPLDAYTELTGTGSRTMFAYPDEPYTATQTVGMLTFTPSVISALGLLTSGGCSQAATNGMLALGVLDCLNLPITDGANIMLSVRQGGSEVTGTFVIDLGQINAMAAGLFLICNVPPNATTTVGATYNGMTMRARDVKVVAGTTTATGIRPGYR